MNVQVTVPWHDVRLLLPFVSMSTSQNALNGVRLEFPAGARGDEVPARAIAVGGRRMAVLQSRIDIAGKWPEGIEPAFTVPFQLIKRFKKPGANNPDHVRLQLEIEQHEEPLPPDAAEGAEPEIYFEVQVTAAAYFDPLQITETLRQTGYPDWRKVIPPAPYEPARDVKVYGSMIADFSAACACLEDGGNAIGFYRTVGAEDSDRAPLIVRSASQRFFGVLSPAPLDSDSSQYELPLWVNN